MTGIAALDAAAAVEAAQSSDGSLVSCDVETSLGRMAGLAVPAGTLFWIVETDGANQPDRSA